MSSPEGTLSERVEISFIKLSAAASELNEISDELGKSISELDDALKKLNLGLTVWVTISQATDEFGNFWIEEIGYSKVSKWGISLRTMSGSHMDEESGQTEVWLFNDAPRVLRLTATEKLPDLLETLSAEATLTTERVRKKLSDAKEVAAVVKGAIERPSLPSGSVTRRPIRHIGGEQKK